ncbi:hypothetical protein [Pseudoalteromonas sp.]|uniref:hypothetical protein n=1 Tax=Pseudoalteromonas sp. TaxID=53249 RepID=UPI003566C23D
MTISPYTAVDAVMALTNKQPPKTPATTDHRALVIELLSHPSPHQNTPQADQIFIVGYN